MSFTKSDMDKIISIYEEKGYVTRDDVIGLDSRGYSRELEQEMKRLGYNEAICIEVTIAPGDYHDYSNVLYNIDIFDHDTIVGIMRTQVLKRFN